jgi:hypothetical protein
MAKKQGKRMIDIHLHVMVDRSMTIKELEQALRWLLVNGGHQLDEMELKRIYVMTTSLTE